MDEFGRTRVVRQSELPTQSPSASEDEDEEEQVKRPGHDGFGSRSDMRHYEADREIRTKGVGFYGFSKNEQERQEQLAKLNSMRTETVNARQVITSASEKRKQMLAINAEKIRARRATLQAKKNQLKPEHVPTTGPSVVDESSISAFLQSMRKKVEE